MSQHNEIGKIGEKMAREYLEGKGFKILEQNYKTRYAEIDLVAEKKKALVFVEVRAKVGEQWGSPEDTLDKNKLWKVLQNAKSYMGFAKWQGPCRIDAVCIVLKPDMSVSRLTHHENVVS